MISFREMQRITAKELREKLREGALTVSVDGVEEFEVRQIRGECVDSQGRKVENIRGTRVLAGTQYVDNEVNRESVPEGALQLYDPRIHKPGDKVMIRVKGKLEEAIVPEMEENDAIQ